MPTPSGPGDTSRWTSPSRRRNPKGTRHRLSAAGRPSTSATIQTWRASAPTFSSRTCRSASYAMACRCRRHLAFCADARLPASRR